jgi:hypothetical protein
MKMPNFTVEIHETQQWVYTYEMEAKDSEEAHHIAESKHFEGNHANDLFLFESNITGTYAKVDQDA